MWKVVIIAWVMSADIPPGMITGALSERFANESKCEAFLASKGDLQAKMASAVAGRGIEIGAVSAVCVEDTEGDEA